MKRIAAILLSFLFLIHGWALADQYGTFEWTFENGTLKISGEGDLPDNGCPWNEAFTKATTLELSEGITYFGIMDHSVETENKPLTRVIVHGDRTTIQGATFVNCGKLTEIIFTGNHPIFSGYMIPGNKNVKITFESPEADYDIVDGTIYNKSHSILYHYNGDKKDINVPEGVEIIGPAAFSNTDITSITLPSTLIRIDPSAFWNCKKLTRIEIPESVKYIGDSAFYCAGLEKIKFKTKAVEFSYHCTGVDGKETFSSGYGVFYNTKLKKLSLPACSELNGDCFSGNPLLEAVVIGDGTKSMPGDYYFRMCPKLKSVYIPKSVETFGDFAFLDMPKQCVITCERGAPVIEYGEKNGIKCEIIK